MIDRPNPPVWKSWSFSSVAAVAIAIGLLSVGLSMAIYNENLGKAEKLRDVAVQADILAGSVSAALAFDDTSLAQEYVNALGASHDIEAAGVYTLNGKLVASYARPGAAGPGAKIPRPALFESDRLIVSRPVVQGTTALGSVYLRTVRESSVRRAARYGGIAALVVMAALFLIVLGASNASLVEAHRKLKAEAIERERTEQALRHSQEMEAVAQIEIAAQRSLVAIRHSEQQLQFALHAGQLGSWAIDLETGLLTVSEFFRTNLGLDSTAVLEDADDLDRHIHPGDRAGFRRARERAIRDKTDLEIECRALSPQGDVRWVLLRGHAVYNDDGSARQMAGVSLDITARMHDQAERKAIEEQLVQAQKMEAIGNLTGGMAHDFNNLLGVIIGNLDLLEPQLADRPDTHELLQDALDAAVRGADLTARLLAFARRQPLQPKRIEPNDLVTDIVKLLARTLGESVEISLDLAPRISAIVVDPAQLAASITNLATNARDAMSKGGRLIISTADRHLDADYAVNHSEVKIGDYVMIEVSDTGMGMAPEVLARVFEPFFTTKEQNKGTGLGLSMVFGFVKQSGGHVNVYSEPGSGTTVRLYLPAADTQQEAASAPAPSTAVGGTETILVVEDNAAIRRVVIRLLTEFGYRILEADGAAAASEILANETIDVLLTDIVMPGEVDGIELARRAQANHPALKILLTSGFPEAKLSGRSDGIAGLRLLSKPYRRDDLARTLREVLNT